MVDSYLSWSCIGHMQLTRAAVSSWGQCRCWTEKAMLSSSPSWALALTVPLLTVSLAPFLQWSFLQSEKELILACLLSHALFCWLWISDVQKQCKFHDILSVLFLAQTFACYWIYTDLVSVGPQCDLSICGHLLCDSAVRCRPVSPQYGIFLEFLGFPVIILSFSDKHIIHYGQCRLYSRTLDL